MNATDRSEGTRAVNEIKRKPNTRHAKMPVSQRAKQFMPFAAVTGLDAALREKEMQVRLSFEEKNKGIPIDE